jgi:sugar (pentulose or hexulose) kinase
LALDTRTTFSNVNDVIRESANPLDFLQQIREYAGFSSANPRIRWIFFSKSANPLDFLQRIRESVAFFVRINLHAVLRTPLSEL